MKTQQTFYVVAEFERETTDGWVSFTKSFSNRKEAMEAYDEAVKNPLALKVEFRSILTASR